jgi:hypothetical protein
MYKLAQHVALGPMAVAVGCAASPPAGLRPADDRPRLAGDISIAEAHGRDFGYDPGPVDGRLTAETQPPCGRTRPDTASRSRGGSAGPLVWNWPLGWTNGG